MSLLKNDPVFNKRLVEILDEIIEKGHWENTLFLQATGKKLREFRERLKNELEFPTHLQSSDEATFIHRYKSTRKATDESHLVFILIYCSEGSNVKQWENVISSLAAHSMTRPIYKNESDVQSVLRSKPNKQNDGYLALSISKNDISPHFTKKVPVDRYGNELVVLREGSIRQENIEYFIHLSGRYIYQNGKLIQVESDP
jgi:intracellular multiplication protein IcmQ